LGTLPSHFGGFQLGSTLLLDDGSQIVFGALAGMGGLARLRFDDDGTLLNHSILYDPTPMTTSQIAAIATVTIGSQNYVLTTSAAQNGLTARQIDQGGAVMAQQTIGADDGLWISAPTALDIATVGASTYAVLGAAGSGSLSVIEIGTDGAMIVRDHILDSRDTRFGGVTSVEIIQTGDKTYVIAGGADDGISVFVLLEGGLLVHRATIEDTVDFGLDNISALAGHQRVAALDIFVASSSEPGITQLRFDTGLAGVTATAPQAGGVLTGTAGGDILQGHVGDDTITAGGGADILRDGLGSDVMTGGAGADLFILSADGVIDTITDFTIGEDKIDLSLWPMLRDISQLFISITTDGMRITYGQEVLLVQSANGGPIDYRDLATTDLIGASRLPVGITPGYPGPATPLPTFGDPAPSDQGGPNNMLTPLFQIAAGNLDSLRDKLNAGGYSVAPGLVIDGDSLSETVTGGDRSDLIMAGDGDDQINAMAGNDTVFGRDGADQIDGGDGADTLLGGNGADDIRGGNGQDLLDGGDGDDRLDGGAGDDILFGRAGADTFVFSGGADRIADFEQGVDELVLDPSLWTGLTSVADLLFVYGSFDGDTATIDLGDGNILRVEGVIDPLTFGDDISLF
ncbi:MAG: calcium-binding protein, partial [Paracoccaceae bacterium]|nr:calcium-binding protein [Paracoccaceae bacterium]